MEGGAPDEVAEASQLLTVLLHCRKEARGLRTCQTQHGPDTQECARHRAAFVSCAEAHTMQVVQSLVQIAGKHCPSEVAEFERCKREAGGSHCESLDLAVLRCASQRVLESARAPSVG